MLFIRHLLEIRLMHTSTSWSLFPASVVPIVCHSGSPDVCFTSLEILFIVAIELDRTGNHRQLELSYLGEFVSILWIQIPVDVCHQLSKAGREVTPPVDDTNAKSDETSRCNRPRALFGALQVFDTHPCSQRAGTMNTSVSRDPAALKYQGVQGTHLFIC